MGFSKLLWQPKLPILHGTVVVVDVVIEGEVVVVAVVVTEILVLIVTDDDATDGEGWLRAVWIGDSFEYELQYDIRFILSPETGWFAEDKDVQLDVKSVGKHETLDEWIHFWLFSPGGDEVIVWEVHRPVHWIWVKVWHKK